LRDQLKAGLAAPNPALVAGEGGLSGAAPEAGNEPPPTVAELAERIKALKAAHTIDAVPERTGKRSASAEEPVTARIRRRAEPRNECGVPAATQITRQEPLAKTHRWTMRVHEQDTLAEAEGRSL
jgi:hypothetical protein